MKPLANDNPSRLIEFSGRSRVEKRISLAAGPAFIAGATLTSFTLMRLKRTQRYVVRHLTCPNNSVHPRWPRHRPWKIVTSTNFEGSFVRVGATKREETVRSSTIAKVLQTRES
ncbi:hypothetical protein ANTQUA_LOCUS4118 [Anthophora quadrimaculata]